MNAKQNPKRPIINITGAGAFAELHDEIAAVSEELLVPITVDIAFAHQIVLAAADRIDELMPELEKLPLLDIARIRKLRLYAHACEHAHVLATAPEPVDPRLPRLLEEGAKLREALLSTAELLAQFGEVPKDRVAALRRANGHVEMAHAIHHLGVLYDEIWDRVSSRVLVTREMVDRAPGLAAELHTLIGAKTIGTIAKPSDARGMRLRAFTLLVKAYEECQRAVEYIRSAQGDALSFAPSLFTRRKRSTPSAEPEPVATDPPVTTTEVTPLSAVRTPIRLPITELEPTG